MSTFASILKSQQLKTESLLAHNWPYNTQTPKTKAPSKAKEGSGVGFAIAVFGTYEPDTSVRVKISEQAELNRLATSSLDLLTKHRQTLSQQQQLLRDMIDHQSPRNSDLEPIVAQYKCCQALQAELFVGRWQCYNLLVAQQDKKAAEQADDLLKEIMNSSEAERIQVIVTHLLQYLGSYCTAAAITASPLSRFATVTSLFGLLCVGQDPILASSMMELFAKFCKLSSQAWAKFLVASIQQYLGPASTRGIYQSTVFESLHKIAKVCFDVSFFL